MKIALTKTKTIDIRMPTWLAPSAKSLNDVVGVEFGGGNPQGCPAVRLVRKGTGFAVVAAGFIPPPTGTLPTKWDEMTNQPLWSFPSHFQAPGAALAVVSPDMFLRQTTLDVLNSEAASSAAHAPAAAKPAEGGKIGLKLGLKPVTTTPKPAARPASPVSAPPGVPVSRNGIRSVNLPMEEKPFILEAGLPEYQVLWLSRLLPEGRRPTVASLQVRPAAILSAPLQQPEFIAAGGTAFVIFVFPESVAFAAYRNGSLLLYRECPGVAGYVAPREAVKAKLGLDESMVDSVLDDEVIDPRPALEPFVRPILQQVEISLDYLARRHNLKLSTILLMGLPAGARYWSLLAMDALRLPFSSPSVFAGLELPTKAGRMPELTDPQSQAFLAALGAARAAMEVRQ